jgi:fumarate reductase flavoprotein subunit
VTDNQQGAEYDVVVVGGGGSGLAAAVSAAEQGCSVLVLEKQPALGGTTRISAGAFTASQTRLQQKARLDDDPEAHSADAGRFAPPGIEARNQAALRRYFLGQTAATLHWLMDLGLAFYGPLPEPPNRVPRLHAVVPNPKAYLAVLQDQLLRQGGVVLCQAGVEKLLQSDGRVMGVAARVRDTLREYRARRGVVLAAGDYAGAPDMIGEFVGPQFAPVEGANPQATGDGHKLARAAGGALVNMDIVYGPSLSIVPPPGQPLLDWLPVRGPLGRGLGCLAPLAPDWLVHQLVLRLLVTLQHPRPALFEDGVILVNTGGKRFCNERTSPARELAVATQPGKMAFLLLDERLVQRYSAAPCPIASAFELAHAYVPDYARLRPDITTEAHSLADLAMRRHLPSAALEATVAAYNRYVAGQGLDPFGRQGDPSPLQGQRWVLLGPLKAVFTSTEGGAAINEQMQVLDARGQPVPGLYAVGQNGLGGMILWSHGLHIAWALTSGRLVGRVLGQASGASESKGQRA